jgi:hypothetical protein
MAIASNCALHCILQTRLLFARNAILNALQAALMQLVVDVRTAEMQNTTVNALQLARQTLSRMKLVLVYTAMTSVKVPVLAQLLQTVSGASIFTLMQLAFHNALNTFSLTKKQQRVCLAILNAKQAALVRSPLNARMACVSR